MPRGGSKPGERRGGRQKGSKNKFTAASEYQIAIQRAGEKIAEVLGEGTFEGNAHAYLMAVYKDPSVPREIRIDAAKAAIGYETPRLSATEFMGRAEVSITEPADRPPRETREEWIARRKRELQLSVVGTAAGSAD